MVMMVACCPSRPIASPSSAVHRKRIVPVVVGGPDATSSPEVYEAADFLSLVKPKAFSPLFVDAWKEGVRNGRFSAEKFKADVSSSPVPRFDLLRFDDYVQIGVQYSRGCRLLANSATSSNCMAVCRAPRPTTRCWPNSTGCTNLATEVTSTSSMTTSFATRRP